MIPDAPVAAAGRPGEGLSRSFDARGWETAPFFFDGRLMLLTVAGVATLGPLRLYEIERLLGRTDHSSNTNRAAKRLESLGICSRLVQSRIHVTVALNGNHPYLREIRALGRALYDLYVDRATCHEHTRGRRRNCNVTFAGVSNPNAFDRHVLGRAVGIRLLHLLAEVESIPMYEIFNLLGTSHAICTITRRYRDAGVIKAEPIGHTVHVRLDTAWAAYRPLLRLIKAANERLPEYAAMAAVYKERYEQKQHRPSACSRRTGNRTFSATPRRTRRTRHFVSQEPQ